MIAQRTEIKFVCADCGQRISVDAAAAGMATACPTCSHPLVVPHLGGMNDRTYGESAKTAASRSSAASPVETSGATERRQLREDLAAAERERGVAEASLGMVRRENAQLVERIGRLSAECGQRAADTAAAKRNLAQHEEALAEAKNTAGQLAAELSARETELRETRARLTASEATAARAREDLAAIAAQNAEWQRKLAATESGTQDAAALRSAIQAAEEKLTAEQTARAEAETQRKLQSGQCLLLQDEIARLRESLAESHAGRELLELRDRFETLEGKHHKATAALAKLEIEHGDLIASESQLRDEITAARERAATAESRAEAASDSALQRDIGVLRSIVERQKSDLDECFAKLRRFQRAHIIQRIVYAVFALALLIIIGLVVVTPPAPLRQFFHAWLGK
jgi:chromosome segregation ATPase/DNA-directed RNA polymerase subunit RPC12/RpoP